MIHDETGEEAFVLAEDLRVNSWDTEEVVTFENSQVIARQKLHFFFFYSFFFLLNASFVR